MSSELTDPDFDLSTISRIVVLPLAYGACAPNRREASWNGGTPYSLPFIADQVLVWESPSAFFGGRPPFSPQRHWTATFLRFGIHVTGRHEWANVGLLSDTGFEAAVEIANSLLSEDGSRGVGEWAPALITIGGSVTLGIHFVCLDEETEAEVTRRLRSRAGLQARMTFSRTNFEDSAVSVQGTPVDGSWNPLTLTTAPTTSVHGVASQATFPTQFLESSPIGLRIRTAVPN